MLVLGLDTALVHSATVLLDESGKVLRASYPEFEANDDPYFRAFGRHKQIVEWIWNEIVESRKLGEVLLAYEDYFISPLMTNAKIAELHGILKWKLWEDKVPYVLVGNTKVKKFVGVEKAERGKAKSSANKKPITEYVKKFWPEVESYKKRQREDLGDAFVIAQIGRLVLNAAESEKPYKYVMTLERKVREILVDPERGILCKPGLVELFDYKPRVQIKELYYE
jgi:hypothetical protein